MKYALTATQLVRDAVTALAALAQDNRLEVFRLLVRAGPEGMAAGGAADALELAPNTLTFHFDRLRQASLVTVRRERRSMIYAARFETMNALVAFLTENCFGGEPEKCAPTPVCRTVSAVDCVEGAGSRYEGGA